MAVREVLIFPDKRLYLKATPVVRVDDEIKKLVKDMEETMYAYHGCGLAATQINVQKRIVIMDLNSDDEPRKLLVFINPEIISRDGQVIGDEGCLSVPGVYEKVLRAENVTFKYLDLNNESQQIDCNGLLAVCIQHEIDHLDGKVFVEYLSNLKQTFIKKKMKKIYKPE